MLASIENSNKNRTKTQRKTNRIRCFFTMKGKKSRKKQRAESVTFCAEWRFLDLHVVCLLIDRIFDGIVVSAECVESFIRWEWVKIRCFMSWHLNCVLFLSFSLCVVFFFHLAFQLNNSVCSIYFIGVFWHSCGVDKCKWIQYSFCFGTRPGIKLIHDTYTFSWCCSFRSAPLQPFNLILLI